MDKFWKQIALAAVMGTVLPWIILLGGTGGRQIPILETKPALPTQGQTDPTVTDGITETMRVYIPVQTDENRITLMELEAYLVGVLLAEMPASFGEEALKAQAVVARTYTLRRLQTEDRHGGAVVCGDPGCCQAYISESDYLKERGSQADVNRIREAVSGTSGVILSYEGEPIEATYFSCSGGRTEAAVAVWGVEIPYLQAVDSPGEEEAETFRDSVYFTGEELAAALGRKLTGAVSDWLGAVTHTEGGGVSRMTIGGISYSGTELRELLGLNSTAFELTPGQYGVTVITRGKGHRVGMSQYGANVMAHKGSTWEEILAVYYPGAEIDKVQNIG